MNATEQTPWKTVRLAVALIVQTVDSAKTVLAGLKKTGVLAGLVAPVGGHLNDGEPYFTACIREMKQENSYVLIVPDNLVSQAAAHISVSIQGKRTTYEISAFLIPFEYLGGEFVPDLDEDAELGFKRFEDIPVRLIPPGDEEWVPHAINGKKGARVFIECGTDRRDIRKVTVDDVEVRRVTPA